MFISLNKKILYSILAFMLLITVVFFFIFVNMYSQNLDDRQNSLSMRNKYVVDLLNDNITLRRRLYSFYEDHPDMVKASIMENVSQGLKTSRKELSREQNLSKEMQQNYNKNREALITGSKILAFSLFIILLFIFLLIFLIDYWVIAPVEKMIEISRKVSMGIFSSRLHVDTSNKRLHDEFDMLYTTFNIMLDNMEYYIEETKAHEQFLQKLIDAIPDGIRVIDRDYNVIFANSAFHSMINHKSASFAPKCYSAYGYNCEGCQQRKYTCPVKQILLDGKSEELHTIHEIGKTPLYLNATKLRWGKNKDDVYIIETLHDLSGDVQFSHQQKVSSLVFLSTSIAHEMKNNLGAIRMIFEGILENYYKDVPNTDTQKKYMLLAYNQLIETIKTPERLLRLAQYSENDNAEIDISSAIKDMLLMIDYDAKRRGINILTELDKNILFIGNESDFKMVILNLAQNAIKAMPDGGELRITATQNNKNIYININDSGIGIEPKQIKHIFEPFYSANNKSKSSGLGLAIVNSLVEKMHGKISVKSKLKKGTTFSIRLPIKKNKVKAKADISADVLAEN